ncbi:MAG: MBL fold metallo-hydrolase [Oscillospiraceae bacterium]|nr:MBL fold metallo-hydrolase [Oscillospiraceae bacterium]
MELKQILGNTWCIAGHQSIPLYRTDSTHCILLDTGAQYQRRKIEQVLDENGLTPIGLLCTHTHFDHFGNATYFSEKYHCPVALPLGEAEICRTLDSVKSHLFVFSHGQIRNDPKMSSIPCLVDHVIRPEEQDTYFRGVRFRVLHTPGHSMDHCSYITPDNVCYIGDALMSGHTLHGSKLPYAFDFTRSMETIRGLEDIQCEAMVMAHNGVITDGYRELAQENLAVMLDSMEKVLALITEPMSSDEICRAVCADLGVVVDTPERAQNLERFLRPYTEYLLDTGKIRMVIRNSSLCYERV